MADKSRGKCVPVPPPGKACPAVSLTDASQLVVYTDVVKQEGGKSSCLFYVSTKVNYDTAKAACASVGYHLLTTVAWELRTTGDQTLMYFTRDAVVGNTVVAWWMGGERAGDVATSGWSWVDGTNSSNLNCGRRCGGVWERKPGANPHGGNQNRLSFFLHYDGGTDDPELVEFGFVCEYEFECPAGSYCPRNSDSITPCPAGSYSEQGAEECTRCAGNTISGVGESSCRDCGTRKADWNHALCV